MPLNDTANAFIDVFEVPEKAGGPLGGMTFAAKDLFDIAGKVTGCGNPGWVKTHQPATTTAPAVQAMLDHGATLVGKTHTDELAYSLMGVNAHYGTPLNSKAPDRVPGGSSSGSAAATAAGLVDFALGTDTGGSVRLPASFCGLYGLRTTHGRISLEGVMPLASSFDTCGWFAPNADVMAQVGKAYGMVASASPSPRRLLVAEDAFSLCTTETRNALAPALEALKAKASEVKAFQLALQGFEEMRKVFITCQAAEIWATHGDWITRENPTFGPGVKERFQMAAGISAEDHAYAQAKRAQIAARLKDTLGEESILALPTSPGPAPLLSAGETDLNAFRMAALDLLCCAGLTGLPQLNLPAGTVEGAPVGLSVIAPAGQDETLLETIL